MRALRVEKSYMTGGVRIETHRTISPHESDYQSALHSAECAAKGKGPSIPYVGVDEDELQRLKDEQQKRDAELLAEYAIKEKKQVSYHAYIRNGQILHVGIHDVTQMVVEGPQQLLGAHAGFLTYLCPAHTILDVDGSSGSGSGGDGIVGSGEKSEASVLHQHPDYVSQPLSSLPPELPASRTPDALDAAFAALQSVAREGEDNEIGQGAKALLSLMQDVVNEERPQYSRDERLRQTVIEVGLRLKAQGLVPEHTTTSEAISVLRKLAESGSPVYDGTTSSDFIAEWSDLWRDRLGRAAKAQEDVMLALSRQLDALIDERGRDRAYNDIVLPGGLIFRQYGDEHLLVREADGFILTGPSHLQGRSIHDVLSDPGHEKELGEEERIEERKRAREDRVQGSHAVDNFVRDMEQQLHVDGTVGNVGAEHVGVEHVGVDHTDRMDDGQHEGVVTDLTDEDFAEEERIYQLLMNEASEARERHQQSQDIEQLYVDPYLDPGQEVDIAHG